jgi:hypothetical protein
LCNTVQAAAPDDLRSASTVFGHRRRPAKKPDDDFGTVVSRIDIVRAVASGQNYQTLPFVRPGGEILLRAQGWPKVERVLQAIDAVEALGIDPAVAAPEYWRTQHRPYSRQQHRAWRLRKETTG